MSSCELNLNDQDMFTRILISEFSVFRKFTYMPVDDTHILFAGSRNLTYLPSL